MEFAALFGSVVVRENKKRIKFKLKMKGKEKEKGKGKGNTILSAIINVT